LSQSVMPALSRALVPEVLPAVMPPHPAAPEILPAAPAVPVLPSRVPADLPAGGRQALAAALAGPVPGAQRRAPGETLLPGDDDSPLAWDDARLAQFLRFLRSLSDQRDHRGRRIPLAYLAAVAVAAGAAGEDSAEAAAAWAAAAPARIDLLRAFRTAYLWLIHAADWDSRYSSWTCRGVRYWSPECRRLELYQNSMYLTTSRYACFRVGYWVR
jgi:hypothetical protein